MRKLSNIFNRDSGQQTGARQAAPQSMVDLALETWRLQQTAERCIPAMDPLDAERFANGFEWYLRKVDEALGEFGLSVVDPTGQLYDTGMAVSPLNLDDFPGLEGAVYRVAQTVEPIIMENGAVRKPGSVLLSEEM